jgi:hypothetical protein
MVGRDKLILSHRPGLGALARRVAQGDADRGAFLEAILAGANLPGGAIEPENPIEIGLGRSQKRISRRARCSGQGDAGKTQKRGAQKEN